MLVLVLSHILIFAKTYSDLSLDNDFKRCNTIQATGAFVLLYNLIGLIAYFFLFALVIFRILTKSNLIIDKIAYFLMVIVACCITTAMWTWALCFSLPANQLANEGNFSIVLDASWALLFVSMLFIWVAVVFTYFHIVKSPGNGAVVAVQHYPQQHQQYPIVAGPPPVSYGQQPSPPQIGGYFPPGPPQASGGYFPPPQPYPPAGTPA